MLKFSDFLKNVIGLDFMVTDNEYYYIRGMTPEQETDLKAKLKKAGIVFQNEGAVVLKRPNLKVFNDWKQNQPQIQSKPNIQKEFSNAGTKVATLGKNLGGKNTTGYDYSEASNKQFVSEIKNDISNSDTDIFRTSPRFFEIYPKNKDFRYIVNTLPFKEQPSVAIVKENISNRFFQLVLHGTDCAEDYWLFKEFLSIAKMLDDKKLAVIPQIDVEMAKYREINFFSKKL